MLGINGIWPQRPTDSEYIEQVRFNVQFVDRWRWWMIAYYVGFMSCMLLLTLSATWQWLASWVQFGLQFSTIAEFSGYVGGWIMGCGLGVLLGLHLILLTPLVITPLRTERLLLHYVEQAAESKTTEPSGRTTS